MAQPKDYGFDEDQSMIKDSIRKFLDKTAPMGELRKSIEGTEDPYHGKKRLGSFDRKVWQEMVALGWTALTVPEAQGGAGMNLVTAASLCEELGRAAIATPLTTTLHSTFVLREANTDASNECLGKIAEGQSCTLAIQDAAGSFDITDTEVREVDGVLNGVAYFVQDAQKTDLIIVAARGTDGVGLYLLPVSAAGVVVQPDTIVDLTRDQARVSLSNVAAESLVAAEQAAGVMRQSMPAILTMISADIAGAAEWQLQTTAEYAKIRTQFDRPIGFFQAVKHPIVNMMISVDETRSLVYNAACAYDFEPEDAAKFARMAKSSASDTANFCSNRSVQLHGGIGFTWEADVQIYFKRQMHNQYLYGDGAWQRQELGALV